MNFTAAKDYEGLLKQANAMNRLIDHLERTSSHLRATIIEIQAEDKKFSPEEFDSQREVIQRLTNENESLKRVLDALNAPVDGMDGIAR